MTRTKLLKRVASLIDAAVVVLIISFYSFLAFATDPGPFWRTINDARVTVNGRAIPEAQVYRRPNGMLLMNLRDNYGWQLYRPDTKNIYWCNTIKFVTVPGFIYARDCDSKFCPCVGMGDHVKIEIDSQLKIEPSSIEFNSKDRERIRVSW